MMHTGRARNSARGTALGAQAMILSGPEIRRAHSLGDLVLEPFAADEINPNSYNYRLASELVCMATIDRESATRIAIPDDGLVLLPGRLYLGSTAETIGSHKYAITLLGRSSLGRLGTFLSATADLGHVGSLSKWTLEISVVQPVRIYRGMRIGQVAFWTVAGPVAPYAGRYQGDVRAEHNKDASLTRTTLEGVRS